MVTPQIIQNANQFLARVDLKGGEVPAFVEVVNWLAEVSKSLDEQPVANTPKE